MTDRQLPTLHGERVTLRPIVEADFPAILAILAEPSVARWWGLPGAGDPSGEWRSQDQSVSFVIEVDDMPAGLIQYSEETEADYRHANIDLFLGTAHQGHGLGRDAVRRMARHLFDDLGHHRLTIDPAAANEPAIRAYAAVGFRSVGVMRDYERGPDGAFHDSLLMDMLRDDLR